jgi:membrane protease YdiL (CAAX protease family)
MTAIVAGPKARPSARGVAGLAGTCLLLGLALAIRRDFALVVTVDGVTGGLVFGSMLVAIALVAGQDVEWPSVRPVLAGAVAGGVLVAITLAGHWPTVPMQLGHAAPFGAWAAATVVVAAGEELVLRGVLWNWAWAAGGDLLALALSTILFALIHVPTYGWSVVPLDLGVGLFLGGLRLWFGGPTAPAVAHALADLSTWWL